VIPENFKTHYRKILGEKRAEIFFDFCQRPLKKCVRVNPLKYTNKKFEALAALKNWSVSPIPWCNTGYFLEREKEDRTPLGNISEHLLGGLYIQEASSMLPITALFYGHENINFSGKKVCDVASAPGSKTTQLAGEMNGKGVLVSNELSASRLKALYSNIERCGVDNVLLTNYDGENLCNLLPETFDFLLLDAPCTGEGTIRKNKDALQNWTELDAPRMGNLQKKLITSAFTSLKPGGEMVYSTCTLARAENEEVVEFLQKKFPEEVEIIPLGGLFEGAKKSQTPEGFLCIWPEIFDSEGFFVAKIRKKNDACRDVACNVSTKTEKNKSSLKNFPFEQVSQSEEKQIQKFFLEQWGYALDIKKSGKTLWKKTEEKTIWLFPENAEEIFSRVKCDRIGIPLLTLHKKEWRTKYECGIALGKDFTKNFLEISSEQFIKIFSGEDIPFDHLDPKMKGEFLCVYKNFPVAIGKVTKQKWKNALPRTVVRKGAEG
jgi:16S rRNA (cytosine1407-C5)-methyltransferase